MARRPVYECDGCMHHQEVSEVMSPNGTYADPTVACKSCGASGKFLYVVGASEGFRRVFGMVYRVHRPLPPSQPTW